MRCGTPGCRLFSHVSGVMSDLLRFPSGAAGCSSRVHLLVRGQVGLCAVVTRPPRCATLTARLRLLCALCTVHSFPVSFSVLHREWGHVFVPRTERCARGMSPLQEASYSAARSCKYMATRQESLRALRLRPGACGDACDGCESSHGGRARAVYHGVVSKRPRSVHRRWHRRWYSWRCTGVGGSETAAGGPRCSWVQRTGTTHPGGRSQQFDSLRVVATGQRMRFAADCLRESHAVLMHPITALSPFPTAFVQTRRACSRCGPSFTFVNRQRCTRRPFSHSRPPLCGERGHLVSCVHSLAN